LKSLEKRAAEEGCTRASDGTRLSYRRYDPLAKRKGGVAVIHGYAEYGARYGFLIDALCREGYECWTIDLRGHGGSEGQRGYVARFDEYLDDIEALLALLLAAPGSHFVVAHSMGGLAMARFVEQRRPSLDGVVLSGPFFALAMKVPAIKRWAAMGLSSLLPRLALPGELTAADLTSDEAVQKEWEADKQIVRVVPARWFTEALAAQELASPRRRASIYLCWCSTALRTASPLRRLASSSAKPRAQAISTGRGCQIFATRSSTSKSGRWSSRRSSAG